MYEILPVTPDTPEWFEARREGLGASDTAAILGLSKWSTPRDVYLSKFGVERDFDELRAWVGHKQEQTIADWIDDFHPEVGRLEPGFAARSIEHPWLFATPDRVVEGRPVELKTSVEFARDSWEVNGKRAAPLYYQVQVQQQILVLDAPSGWIAVFHGGRDFELFEITRDQAFIDDYLIPKTRAFWFDNVKAGIEPDPVNAVEARLIFPGVPDLELELTDEQFATLEQRDVEASDHAHLKKRLDAFKDYIEPIAGDATVLTYKGAPAYTFKRQNGAPYISDAERLRNEFPEAWDACVSVPRYPVLRKVKSE